MPKIEQTVSLKGGDANEPIRWCGPCNRTVNVGAGGDYNWHQHEQSKKHQKAISVPVASKFKSFKHDASEPVSIPRVTQQTISKLFPITSAAKSNAVDATFHLPSTGGHDALCEASFPPMELYSTAQNPVLRSAASIYDISGLLVKLNDNGIKQAASFIHTKIISQNYGPHVWRHDPLNFRPPEIYSSSCPRTKDCLNWIFLVSSLNFSFWSEKEGTRERYAVDWKESWKSPTPKRWEGYWSLLAALNRALDEGVPITDPAFYSDPKRCPDSFIEHVFRPSPDSKEMIPLLSERIAIMRQVGSVLCSQFNGSYHGFFEKFNEHYEGRGTALQAVEMIVEYFPSFRDEVEMDGRKVYFWKRAQILIAETWAAFYPAPSQNDEPHPFFPEGISQLTMFADYRVPQILHRVRILEYDASVLDLLHAHTPIAHGDPIELSIRVGSILAVEAVKNEIVAIQKREGKENIENLSSVLIDFWLWDTAKLLEKRDSRLPNTIELADEVPIHRTRSIWY